MKYVALSMLFLVLTGWFTPTHAGELVFELRFISGQDTTPTIHKSDGSEVKQLALAPGDIVTVAVPAAQAGKQWPLDVWQASYEKSHGRDPVEVRPVQYPYANQLGTGKFDVSVNFSKENGGIKQAGADVAALKDVRIIKAQDLTASVHSPGQTRTPPADSDFRNAQGLRQADTQQPFVLDNNWRMSSSATFVKNETWAQPLVLVITVRRVDE